MELYIAGLWLVINMIAFALMGSDKRRAVRNKRRISERRLWLFAWLFGAVGAWAGMVQWRHKTKHASFRIGLPLLSVIQCGLLIVLYWSLLR
ncbi:DUF1294 domain-containing protein [Aureibacillus halotolerans]|uniref:DUF1294 domain-containing protein n=1 Tax=Aureibacillus halotolerans TaxID=1508390 RepID=UPI003C7C9A3E